MQESQSPYFAAVDLGSNSFHMLIVRADENRVETVDRVKEMVQIARGMKGRGSVDAAAQERALECLRRFAERLRDIPPAQVRAVGTKALRTAKNATQFLRAAEQALGHSIQTISGYEEARLVYNGLANTVANDGALRFVVDVGGGSTEFIIGRDYHPYRMESLGLGCVTYVDKYFLSGVNERNMRKAYLAACTELELIRLTYLKRGWDVVYGTSGTMRTIADMVAESDGGAVITRAARRQRAHESKPYWQLVFTACVGVALACRRLAPVLALFGLLAMGLWALTEAAQQALTLFAFDDWRRAWLAGDPAVRSSIEVLAAVAGGRDRIDLGARGVHRHIHVGQLMLDRLITANRAAKSLPFLGIFCGHFQTT